MGHFVNLNLALVSNQAGWVAFCACPDVVCSRPRARSRCGSLSTPPLDEFRLCPFPGRMHLASFFSLIGLHLSLRACPRRLSPLAIAVRQQRFKAVACRLRLASCVSSRCMRQFVCRQFAPGCQSLRRWSSSTAPSQARFFFFFAGTAFDRMRSQLRRLSSFE